MRENRFRLVVRGVRDDDPRGAAFGDQPLEERIPEPARGVLKVPLVRGRGRRNVFAPDDTFQGTRARQLLHKSRVGIRFRTAQHVIEVHDE